MNHRHNNQASQQQYDNNKEHYLSQVNKVKNLLLSGEVLTTKKALVKYDIGDLRRRVKDLRDNNIDVRDRLIEGRFKEYYILQSDEN